MACGISIQLLSDLHLETKEYSSFKIVPAAETLAILGDIGSVNDKPLPDLLRRLVLQFRRVIYVPGNNEFHFSSHDIAVESLWRMVVDINSARVTNPAQGELVLLNRTRLDLSPKLTILGCTLWSDLTCDPSSLAHITASVGDFKHISGFNPEHFRSYHRKDIAWLRGQVDVISKHEPHRKVMIMTHHAPTLEGTSRPDLVGGIRESVYASELSGTDLWREPVRTWAFGHTHWSCDFVKGGVRVVSNQRGRASTQGSGFNPCFVIHL